MTERMFKGDGPLASAERDAELDAVRQAAVETSALAEAKATIREVRRRAEAEFHTVTITTVLEDEGTDDEWRSVDSVRFVCTAPPEAQCRTYPADCGCESWVWNEAGTHDESGHVRTSGNPCWLTDWFGNEGAIYAGSDADDRRDDCIPATDRSGTIIVTWEYEWVEWEWAEELPEPPALFDLESSVMA